MIQGKPQSFIENGSDKKFKKKLYAINLPAYKEQISKSYLNTKGLKIITVDNGIILPLRKTEIPAPDAIYEGGVCDEDFKFISGHIRVDNTNYDNYETVRSYKPSEVDYIDEEVIYAGTAFSHFGHFLLESISRLWWVIQNNKLNIKVVFLKNRPFDSPFLQLLNLIGLKKENILFLEKPTKFSKVIVPEQSMCFYSYYHDEFLLPYNAILKNIEPEKHKKIYLSRTKFSKKDLINEEYFENFYKDMGYKIVYPEQLDIKEQIALAAGADEIVSAIGTVSHLALFAKKNTKIISLLRARTFVTTVQIIINQAKNLDFTFVDVTCNILPHRYSANCFYIGPNSVWKEFLKQEYDMKLDLDLFDYFNSNNSNIGDYFKQWIKVFSTKNQIKKIKNETSLDILKNLETIFADQSNDFVTKSESLIPELIDKPTKLSLFSDRKFIFSRYDGSYARNLHLDQTGSIKTIKGKANDNESFWVVKNNELIFLNRMGDVTSRYFSVKQKEGKLFLLGYYEPNKEIIFRLEEI